MSGRPACVRFAGVVAAGLLGCDAVLEAPLGPVASEREAPGPASRVGPARRLTALELANALEDAFPGVALPAAELPADPVPARFDGDIAAQQPSGLYVAAQRRWARAVAEAVVATSPCGSGAVDCAAGYVRDRAERLFRRPLTGDQLAAYLAPLDAPVDADERLRLALEMLLMAPEFLYRVPRAPSDGQLDAFALAERLSFFLWSAPPDDELKRAARTGALLEPAERARQVDRMLDDERSEAAFLRFICQWLDLGALERADAISPALRSSLRSASERFVVEGLWRTGARLDELFTSRRAFIDERVAERIGVPSPPEGAESELSARRGGWLTRPTFLMTHALPDKPSPVQRGNFVYDRLLCAPFPPPPPDAEMLAVVPDDVEVVTNRDYYAATTQQGRCNACHADMNAAGYVFEHFDQFGRWRDLDRGATIDDSGSISGHPVDGAAELSAWLASAPAVRACAAKHWLEYASGGGPLGSDLELRATVADALATLPLSRIPGLIALHPRFGRLGVEASP